MEMNKEKGDGGARKPNPPIWVTLITIYCLVIAILKIHSSIEWFGIDQDIDYWGIQLPAVLPGIVDAFLGLCMAGAGFFLLLLKNIGRLLYAISVVAVSVLMLATRLPNVTRDARGIGYTIGVLVGMGLMGLTVAYLYSDKVNTFFKPDGKKEGEASDE
jgi:hypothetical protein